jgi:hypothetical protein
MSDNQEPQGNENGEMSDASEFANDVAGAVKGAALTAGAGAGLAAASTVYSGVVAAGLSAAAVSPGVVFVVFPAVGAYAAWKLAKTITKPFTKD